MKALIVDDERLARAELKRLLAAFPDVEVVGEAATAAEARERLQALAPDLLFLDIEMPGGTGFDLLASLDEAPAVVFTTAYDAHAVRAFEVNALDYLLKPIDPRRLAAAVEKVAAAHRARAPAPGAGAGSGSYLERVFVRDGERCFFVWLRDVPLLESEGNYTLLHLGSHRPMLGRSLSYLEERLDPRHFFRASRRHIVNLQCIESIEPGPGSQLVVRVCGGLEVEMSRRQSQRFKELMSP